jgi:hypothetical protein
MSEVQLEGFAPRALRPDEPRIDGRRAGRDARSERTRALVVTACRASMQMGQFRPPLQACCAAVGRSIRTGWRVFGSVEALHLEAADDQAMRDAIAERVLGCERTALSDETLQRLVRALVTGAA